MSIMCEFTLQTRATPEQLMTLGTALWRWCNSSTRNTGGFQYLDNQVLADLISGRLPESSQTPRQCEQRFDGIHFRFCDEVSPDRRAAIASLRCEMPFQGIKDIMVDGISWKLIDPRDQTSATELESLHLQEPIRR
jgi:hypothetical protein